VTKKGGGNARNNFSRNTRIVREKNVGKNRRKKVRKNVFLFSHEYRDQKMGEKNPRNNFSRNTQIVRAKKLGKNCRKKVRKKVFVFIRIS